jgi:hypothetical protein
MQASVARPSLECTRTTCRDYAPAILHAASACRVCFGRHHRRLPLLASSIVQVGRGGTPENGGNQFSITLGVRTVEAPQTQATLVIGDRSKDRRRAAHLRSSVFTQS